MIQLWLQTFNEKQPQAKPNVQPVTEAPYQYQHASATSSSAAADDLLRRQAELDQREAELARKEQEMQRTMQGQSMYCAITHVMVLM